MKKILYLSINDWIGMKQRARHIAEKLSVNHKVIYVSHIMWKKNYYKGYTTKEYNQKKIYYNENLIVLRRKYFPFNRNKIINMLNILLKKIFLNKIIKYFKPDVLWITIPEQIQQIPPGYNGKIIYDCMDNHSKFNNDIKQDIYEKALVKLSNYIFVTSNDLYNKISTYSKNNITIVNNGVDIKLFQDYYMKDKSKIHSPLEIVPNRKIVGYFGTVMEWFDVDLLILLAKNMPNIDFIIIGPIENKQIFKASELHHNIKLIGFKKFDELPPYLYHFDVCIMPFIVNDLIRSVNPVKIYEYLSMGKPVVMPYYNEVSIFSKYVYFSNNSHEFLEKIELALYENNPILITERINFAKLNSWESRVHKIEEIICNL
jgi:teichuronic acid biosynthesis glycosyltransferase TuaH